MYTKHKKSDIYEKLIDYIHQYDAGIVESDIIDLGADGERKRTPLSIVLYGAGAAGIHIEKYIRSVQHSNIVCWSDKNYEGLQDAMNVISPREITSYDYDYAIVSILRESTVQSAKRELINLGVPEVKILWVKQKYIDNLGLLLEKVVWKGKI